MKVPNVRFRIYRHDDSGESQRGENAPDLHVQSTPAIGCRAVTLMSSPYIDEQGA